MHCSFFYPQIPVRLLGVLQSKPAWNNLWRLKPNTSVAIGKRVWNSLRLPELHICQQQGKKKREIKSVWLTKAYVKYKVNSVYTPCQNWQQENTKHCLKNFRSIRNSWKPAHYRGYLLRARQRWLWWQVIKKLKLLPYMGNYVQFTNFIGLLNLDKTGWETAYRQHKKHDEIYFCVTMLISRPPVELVIGLTINRQPPYRFIKVKPHNRTWSKSIIFFLLQSHFIPSSSPLKKELMKHRNGVNILTDLLIFKSFE